MDFTQAMSSLEKGQKIRRPNWAGYLFLDVDGNIKHAGTRADGEKFWSLDTGKEDWETLKKDDEIDEPERVEIETHEVTQSRLETMMEATACHIKRLYYLEEIIGGQHRSMKSISDNFIIEMEETRKMLAKTVSAIPRMEARLAKLNDDFLKLELRELVSSYKHIIAEVAETKKQLGREVKENTKAAKREGKLIELPAAPAMAAAEQKEMEDMREKLIKRTDIKLKGLKKPAKGKKAKKA